MVFLSSVRRHWAGLQQSDHTDGCHEWLVSLVQKLLDQSEPNWMRIFTTWLETSV